MQFFSNVLKSIGIANRYRELQVANIAFYLVIFKVIFSPPNNLDAALFLLAIVLHVSNSVIEIFRKRGVWDKVTEVESELHFFRDSYSSERILLNEMYKKLSDDFHQTKNIVTLLNNKQVMTQFQQGLINKQKASL